MKTLSNNLKDHFGQDVTTIATCWKVTRTDGVVFGFTDHDDDIEFGSITYHAETGYTRTAISSDQSFTVDNMEVFGILNADYIDEHDLRNGVYNYARIDIFAVNWSNLTHGSMALRRGWFGEVTVTPNGYFTTELRGLTQALTQNFGDVISPTCRTDLGSSKCKIPLDPPVRANSHTYAPASFVKVTLNSTGGAVDPYEGLIYYTTAGGTTASSQGAFNRSGTTADGGVTWIAYNSFTKQGVITAVASRKLFTVSGLTVPASGLYGLIVDALNQSYLITGGSIASGSYPIGVGFNVVTCDVYADNGNTLNIDAGVPGGSGLVSSANMLGTSHATMSGPYETIEAILSQGLNWVNTTTLTGVITITSSDTHGRSSLQTIAVPQNESYYTGATITFVSGDNAGRAMEVQSYVGSLMSLWLSMPFLPQAGDVFRIAPGCDLSRANCRLFGNVLNFRGEPDLPGQDFLFSPNLGM